MRKAKPIGGERPSQESPLLSKTIVWLALSAALWSTAAFAQPVDSPEPGSVRMTLGPLFINPTIALTNVGVDNNVFNEPDQLNPKSDFTMTVTPASDFWLRFGSTWLTATVKENLVWYQEFSSERTANTSYAGAWRVPIDRLVLRAGATYLNARDRPGFEIDTRPRRTETGFNATAELRTLSATSIVATASRLRVGYDANAVFHGANLEDQLNRVSLTYGGGIKYQVTSLTALALTATRIEDRFEFSSLRDSNSTAASVSIAFDAAALIKGSAAFGYRDFQPVQPGLESFKGATAAVNLSTTLLDATRLGVGFNRDIQYSFDVGQPYYVQTAVDFNIAQQIFGPIDVVARVGAADLAYRDRAGAAVDVANRTDRVRTYGGGAGYHIGKDIRLGVNIDQSKRTSAAAGRQYSDLRIGSSLTYGY
jgi:hypothetical protein